MVIENYKKYHWIQNKKEHNASLYLRNRRLQLVAGDRFFKGCINQLLIQSIIYSHESVI